MFLYRDHVWKIHYCKFPQCKVAHIRFLEEIKAEIAGTKVVGIATSQGCAPGVSYVTSLSQEGAREDVYFIEVIEESSHSFGPQVSFIPSFKFSDFFSLSVEVGGSYAYAFGDAKVNQNGYSKSFTAGSSQSLEYTGPGAALIVADVKEYKIKNDNLNVEYMVSCDNGKTHKEQATKSLTGQTYGQTHYTQRFSRFDKEGCSRETEICLDRISGENVLNPLDVVFEFENCIEKNTDNATVL